MTARRFTKLSSTPLALVTALLLAAPGIAQAKSAEAKAENACHPRGGKVAAGNLAEGGATPAATRRCDKLSTSEDMVTKAEMAVANAPRKADLRAALGMAYLRDGRFQSATAALGDAIALGDTQPRTQLSLALAQIGNGQTHDALATLDANRTTLPAADLGLALALAGEPGRGVAILGDALRSGDPSPKLRANLAYAYALDGRWAEARNLAALDMAADTVDERMTEWAATAQPDAAPRRVAAMLNVAIKADAGMPTALALKDGPSGTQAAQLASAGQVAAPLPTGPVLGAASAAELPPVAPRVAEPAALPTPDPLPASPAASNQTPAFAQNAQGPAPLPAPEAAPRFHAVPAQGAAPAKLALHTPKAHHPRTRPAENAAETTPTAAHGGGSHVVQLGAFLSEKNARAARAKALGRDKRLTDADVTIAKAVVGSQTFWRVSLGGLDAAGAAGKCEAIRKSGGTCFARNDTAPAPRLAEKPVLKKDRKTLALADKSPR